MGSDRLAFAHCLVALLLLSSIAHGQQTPAEIRDSVHRKHPGDPVAGSQAANAALEDRALSEQVNPRQRAASVFLGYYAKNTLSIPRVCSAAGINIESYADQFEREHRSLLAVSSKYVNAQAAIDRVNRGSLADATTELNRLANSMNTDIKGACSFIQQNGKQLATGAHFSKIVPRVHAQLVAE